VQNEKQFHSSHTAPDAATAQELLSVLMQAGFSNTRARRAVIVSLSRSTGPLSPAQLLALGREQHPELGLVTVYRTLDILEGLGLVRKLHLEEGCHSYALSALGMQQVDNDGPSGPRAHGHHVICRRCHRAVEFEGCDLDSVVAAVETATGFQVREHWLELFGTCPACLETGARDDR
jgi:Fe2+ or Zn2+ uptake regulation protein